MKLSNSQRQPMPQVRRQMRKAAAIQSARASPFRHQKATKVRAATTVMMKSPPIAEALIDMGGRPQPVPEKSQQQQDGEASDIKNSLHRPHRYLRRKTQVGLARDQVRANQFACSPQKRQTGEPDDRGDSAPMWWFCDDRPQKNLPAHSSQHIRKINENDSQQNVQSSVTCRLSQKVAQSKSRQVRNCK